VLSFSTVKALRFDVSKIDATRRDQNGYLEVDATVTRTGVFIYRHPNGTTTRELRHPKEVFNADSLSSLKSRPVTFDHPAVGKLDSKNTKQFAVGYGDSAISHDEQFVKTKVTITDEDVISKALDAKRPVREISCGYDCDLLKEDGVYNGERYDHVQKNIVYNHIAIVPRGRAGSDVRLHLDAAQQEHFDAKETDETITVQCASYDNENESVSSRDIPGVEGVKAVYYSETESSSVKEFVFQKSAGWTLDKAKEWSENHRNDSADVHTPTRVPDMKIKLQRGAVATKSFKIDAFEVTTDGTAESAEKAINEMGARLDSSLEHIRKLEGQIDTMQGRIDSMDASGEISNRKVLELAKQRADVEGVAHYVGLKNFGNLETQALKKAIVIKCAKSDSLDPSKLTDEYIAGRYDTICENIVREKKGLSSLATLRDVVAEDPRLLGMNQRDDSGSSPREKLAQDTAEMWKRPAAA